jgi:hypothetical protein
VSDNAAGLVFRRGVLVDTVRPQPRRSGSPGTLMITAPQNNRMKLTKRPRGATVGPTGGAACAFAHRAFRSLSGCWTDLWSERRGLAA